MTDFSLKMLTAQTECEVEIAIAQWVAVNGFPRRDFVGV
jgi:hypothetical protein